MYFQTSKTASTNRKKLSECVLLDAVSISARMGGGSMGREVPFKSGGPYMLRPAKHTGCILLDTAAWKDTHGPLTKGTGSNSVGRVPLQTVVWCHLYWGGRWFESNLPAGIKPGQYPAKYTHYGLGGVEGHALFIGKPPTGRRKRTTAGDDVPSWYQARPESTKHPCNTTPYVHNTDIGLIPDDFPRRDDYASHP